MGQVVPKSPSQGRAEGRRCGAVPWFYLCERRRNAGAIHLSSGENHFIVTPVYKGKRTGETMKDILLKLMLADLENGDILNTGGSRRYNILGNTDCPTPEEGGYFETVG